LKIQIIPNAHAVCIRTDNGDYVKDLVVTKDVTIRMLYKLKKESDWHEKTFMFNTEPASIVFDGMVITDTEDFVCCPDSSIDCFVIVEPDDIRRYPA
jgi:hypothetical protein